MNIEHLPQYLPPSAREKDLHCTLKSMLCVLFYALIQLKISGLDMKTYIKIIKIPKFYDSKANGVCSRSYGAHKASKGQGLFASNLTHGFPFPLQ